jgi:hypothetical protein
MDDSWPNLGSHGLQGCCRRVASALHAGSRGARGRQRRSLTQAGNPVAASRAPIDEEGLIGFDVLQSRTSRRWIPSVRPSRQTRKPRELGSDPSRLPRQSVVPAMAGDLIASQRRERVARVAADRTEPSGWNRRDSCFDGVSPGMEDQLAGRPYCITHTQPDMGGPRGCWCVI